MGSQAPASPPPSQIPRPPTPPRESNKNSADEALESTRPLPTPDSSHEFTTPVDTSRKKVGWSSRTEYQEHPSSTKRNASIFPKVTPIPPSGARKPPRSILKSRNALVPRDPNDSTTPSPTPTYPSFAAMLESVVRQLAGEDRISRIDAYTIFSAALKACNNVPDIKALKDKMGLISQFVQRDFFAKTSDGSVDSVIVINALLLLTSLLQKPSVMEFFDHDFCIFVIDHAISAFETGQASKEIITRLLLIVGYQNFSNKVMNPERVGRLITALHNIGDRVKGKNIELGRLAIYSRLLKQGKSSMLANTTWVEDMLHAMISSFKEIRASAIAFGLEAGLSLGTESQTSRALQELFKGEEEDYLYAEFYTNKLRTMRQSHEERKHVPQIWIVVILFLRHKSVQLQQWRYLKPWMMVIQECFNKGDSGVVTEACRAWNRFIFVLRLDEKTNRTIAGTLEVPIVGLMGKKNPTGNLTEYRNAIVGCICNLLYYSFRPGASSAQIERYWDAFVVRLMTPLSNDPMQACLILNGLFDQTPKIWVDNRANTFEPITPAELPALNPQWIRKNITRIISVVKPLIQNSFADLSKSNSPVSILWNTLCGALSAAGAMEIKVSNDTMNSVAQIYGMLYQLWNQHVLSSNLDTSFFQGFGYLISSMMSNLGVLPFTEKDLSLSFPNTFSAINTPSHRPRTPRGEVKSPLHHLLFLIFQARGDLQKDDHYNELIKTILLPFFNARESRRTRLDFIQEINQLLLVQDPLGNLENLSAWKVLAALTEQALGKLEESRSSGPNSGYQLGSEYRCAVKVLESGLRTTSDSTSKAALRLFQVLVARVKEESGDGGVAIAVIEPLAKGLLERQLQNPTILSVSYCTALLLNSQYPKNRQALDAARRRLWGATGGQRLPMIDPYNPLYELVSSCLEFAYSNRSFEECKDLISGVFGVLERCPEAHLLHFLEECQKGLSCWVRDADHKLTDRKTATMLCERTNTCIKKLPNHNSMTLKKLGDLISGSLESRHKFVANSAVETWNSTFGNQRSLEYPPRVLEALARLRQISEISLPSFPDTLPSDFDHAPPIFFDSQVYEESSYVSPVSSNHPAPSLVTLSLRSSGQKGDGGIVVEVNRSAPRKRAFEGTPEPVARKQARVKPNPKLRHDDSQIQFAPIESSPMSDVIMDSQLLTDRQKEIKERQKLDASIFRNFGSSPSMRKDIGLTVLSPSPDLPSRKTPSDRPRTPVINSAAPSIFDDDAESSPTPRSGNIILPDSDAIEPPSSPPKITTNLPSSQSRSKSSAISQDYGETSWGNITVGSAGVLESRSMVDPWEIGLAKNISSNESTPKSLPRGIGSKEPSPVRARNNHHRHSQSPELGSDAFQDALSTPAKLTLNKPKDKANIQESAHASLEPSPLSRNTPEPSQGSQRSIARGILDRALNLPTNIKSFISPPKQKTPLNTASSPLDEESVLRIMNQLDQPEKETPVRASSSQPISRQDYNNLSALYSSGVSKKRKLPFLIPGSDEDKQQSHSEWDSQESWNPSQPTHDAEYAFDQPVNKALLFSTIPETPIRSAPALGGTTSGPALPLSNRPFTRSLKRKAGESHLATSGITPQSTTGPDTQELELSSRILDSQVNRKAKPIPKPSIDLGGSQLHDFDHDLSLDFGQDDGDSFHTGTGPERIFASTPKAKSVVEMSKSSDVVQFGPTASIDDSLLNNKELESPSLPLRKATNLAKRQTPLDIDVSSESEELPRERGSSPSQQLLHDSNESSQRLQLATETSSVALVQNDEPEILGEQNVLASFSVEQLLRASMDKLGGVGLGRNEVFVLEGLLMDVKRKLFEAEERGREASRQVSREASRDRSG